MTTKTRRSFSLSAAVAASLISAATISRTQGANADGVTIPISGTASNDGLFGQIYGLSQPSVVGAEPGLIPTVGASTNFTAGLFPILNSGLNQLTPVATGYSNVNFNNTNFGAPAPFNVAPYNSTLTDFITARWSGYISLPAGVTTFATNSDDGSVIYIDGVRVVNNNLFQGNIRRIGQTVSFATAGVHEIVIAYYEGNGGAGVEARYAPGVATTNVTDAAFNIIPVNNGGSNQILTGVQNTALTPADGAVTFTTPGSTGGVNFTNTLQANMGALTFAGNNTLNYKGAAARFTSTTFNSGGTNVLAVSAESAFSQDIALGQLSDGGTAVRLQKTGPGQLLLDQTTNPNTMNSGSVIEVRGGGITLAGTNGGQNPLGGASIELGSILPSPSPAGVTIMPSMLTLTSKSGNAVFDNAVNVTSSATIAVQQLANPIANITLQPGSVVGVTSPPASVSNVSVTLGSAANGVTVADGQTVSFQLANGYSLDLAGGVTGAGNVVFGPGVYTLNKPVANTGTLTTSTTATSIFSYNVSNAAGDHLLAVGGNASQITIANTVGTIGGDSFGIGAGNILSLPSPAIGGALTRDANLFAAPLSIIAQTTAGSANAVQGLGTNSDLFFGLAANLTDNVTVGSVPGSTPWRGISTDRLSRTLTGGTITALSNFQFSNILGASLDIAGISVAAPNGPVVASINMVGGARLRTTTATTALNSNVTFTVNTGVFQLVGAQSLGNNANANLNARVIVFPGAALDLNPAANTLSGHARLLHGSFLQMNDANNLGGIGTISGESGAIVQLQNPNTLFNANATQTLSTLSAATVYRMETDLGASLAATTNPAGNFEVVGNNRTNTVVLSAGIPTRKGYVSGLLFTDFNAAGRTLNAAGGVTIGAGGGTLAGTAGQVFTIAAPVTVSPGGGRALTIGTTRIVDSATNNDIRNGTVLLGSTANNWGTGTDALAQLNIVGRANLQNAVAAGVSALPQGENLTVNLGGTYQINGGTGGASSTVQLGLLFPQGGVISLNRNATTPDALSVNLNAPIVRTSNFGPGRRGSVVFQTVDGQSLGTNDKVTFASAADAPARINRLGTTINMVAPWMIAVEAAPISNPADVIPTFLDVIPGFATTIGLTPASYTPMLLSGGTGSEILDNSSVATLTGPIIVAALRTNANISGQTIHLTTGGLLFRGSGAPITISSAIDFGTSEAVIGNAANQINVLSGPLSSTGGLTKFGATPVTLSNTTSTLTGGITINEGVLRPGVNNGMPQNNVVTINSGGVLDLNNFDQSVRGIQGSGVVLNNVGGTRTLTLTSPAAGETQEFTGTIRNAGGIVAVTKTGPGTQILSGTLHYTGATNINEGTLLIDGVNTASSAYNVAPAATLGGAGIITGPIAVSANGTLSPGGNTLSTEIASMRIGNLNLGLDANLAIDLSGGIAGTGLSASAGYDQVDAIGTVSVNGANLQLELNYAPALGDRLFIINNDQIDAIVGTFAKLNGATTTLTEGSLFNLTSSLNSNTYFFRISYLGEFYTNNVGTGNDVVLTAVVPESTSAAALAIAAAGLLSRRRRK